MWIQNYEKELKSSTVEGKIAPLTGSNVTNSHDAHDVIYKLYIIYDSKLYAILTLHIGTTVIVAWATWHDITTKLHLQVSGHIVIYLYILGLEKPTA